MWSVPDNSISGVKHINQLDLPGGYYLLVIRAERTDVPFAITVKYTDARRLAEAIDEAKALQFLSDYAETLALDAPFSPTCVAMHRYDDAGDPEGTAIFSWLRSAVPTDTQSKGLPVGTL